MNNAGNLRSVYMQSSHLLALCRTTEHSRLPINAVPSLFIPFFAAANCPFSRVFPTIGGRFQAVPLTSIRSCQCSGYATDCISASDRRLLSTATADVLETVPFVCTSSRSVYQTSSRRQAGRQSFCCSCCGVCFVGSTVH